MNKSELIDQVVAATGSTKAVVGEMLEAILERIANALNKNEEVTLVGFGAFKVRSRAARTGRNPKTGETLMIKASKVPSFKAGKGLKDAVNK